MSHGPRKRAYRRHDGLPVELPGPKTRWMDARLAVQLAYDRGEITIIQAQTRMAQLDHEGPWGDWDT